MDNYLKLYKQKQYLKIIADLEHNKNSQDIYLVIDSFIALNNLDAALKHLEDNFSLLFKDNPSKALTLNIDLILNKNDFAYAFNRLNTFDELPYVSMEVEDLIKDLKSLVNTKMKEFQKSYKDEDIKETLKHPQSDSALLNALYQIENKEFNDYVPLLKKLLVSKFVSDKLKTLILLMFNDHHYEGDLTLIKNGLTYEVNPYFLEPIIAPVEIERLIFTYINEKDISIIQTMKQLLSEYALNNYPLGIYDNAEIIIYAFYLWCLRLYQKDEFAFKQLLADNEIDFLQVENTLKDIQNNFDF